MPGNTFGSLFRLTTFGESHGVAIGGVIDGCPAGLEIDVEEVQLALDRRKPGQSEITTQRKESDTVQFLSGIFEGRSTGAPIGFLIQNTDQQSKDYSHLADAYRPSHADYTYEQKYGHRDYRGGGRSSARETACRVVAGAMAAQLLAKLGVSIAAWVHQVHEIGIPEKAEGVDLSHRFENPVRCPHPETAQKMMAAIEEARDAGDSLGGVIATRITGVPPGLGEPVFDKLHADLGKAMLSINAVKGFEIGSGFAGTRMRGSEHNDVFESSESGIRTRTNHSGGVQGGISNGEEIAFKVAFKPTATVLKPQESVNKQGENIILEGKGRHDPCVLPRAVPIVEAMAALVLADHYLRSKTSKL
ncbi:MAG: chorismate synthase [Cryomorphaceae bacterium]|nr:MAG: chorismate synthase [Cryomorphaceae bacterium]